MKKVIKRILGGLRFSKPQLPSKPLPDVKSKKMVTLRVENEFVHTQESPVDMLAHRMTRELLRNGLIKVEKDSSNRKFSLTLNVIQPD